MQYTSCTTNVNMTPSHTNRFVYFKNSALIDNTVNHQKPVKNTILINPNFKLNNIYINPNFSGAVCSKSVYINPNVFKTTQNLTTIQASAATQKSVIASSSLSNYCAPRNTFVDRVKTCTVNKSKPIVSTRTKLIRLPANEKLQKPATNSVNNSAREQRIIKSKYSLVKTDVKSVMPLRTNNFHKVKSKFKIDNRITTTASTSKKDLYKKRNVINLSPRKRNSYVKIGGVLYRKSQMKLQRSGSFENKTEKKKLATSRQKIHKIINKNGVRYEVNINRRALKRMSDVSAKRTITPKKKILLSVLSTKKNFVKSAVLKRKSTPPSSHKLKKCNVPCMFYRKFGRCRGKTRGTCNKVHDPAHIIICPRFLQGACVNNTCLLSHNVSPEKMPTCKFFLEGMCSREDCPYLHVKLSPKADICVDFLRGYCKKAKECDKRHQNLCPEFEKNGKCPRRKCPYPHGNVVRSVVRKKSKLLVKQQTDKQKCKGEILGKVLRNKEATKINVGATCNNNTRYYKELLSGDSFKDSEIGFKRSKLDKLPCFIPLANCSDAAGC